MLDDSSKILSASIDHTVKIWNPENGEMEADINFGHEIQFMDLKEEFLILATDVLSTDVKPSDPVGVVTLVNMRDNSRLHCKVSLKTLLPPTIAQGMPFTTISSFSTEIRRPSIHPPNADSKRLLYNQ